MVARIRFLTQAAFLVLSLAVFFGFAADRRVVAFWHGLHIFPSLSALPWLMLPAAGFLALAMTAALILGTLAAGRLYCSFLCPVGLIQDLSRRLGRALAVAQRSTSGWTGVRFLVLAMSLTFLALGSSCYHYPDHFSNLGRVYGMVRALQAGGPLGWSFSLGLIFLAVIVLAPLRWPRWFCGAICPSGTLFMLLQQAAPLKVRSSGCGGDCVRCASICPAMCLRDGRIDGKLCINCLECVSACDRRALELSWRWPWSKRRTAARQGRRLLSRREFLAAAGLSVLGAGAAAWLRSRLLVPAATTAVIPPGGRNTGQFLARCVACATCVSVCPTKVLAPAGREAGIAGLAKVRLDFERSYCSYECNACLAVCPSGALSYFPLEVKRRLRVGLARLRRDLCISYIFARDCGACQEVCPTGAIVMERFRSTFVPVLKPDYCIGCGACQFACPTRPRKAIAVEPVEVQTFAFAPGWGRRGLRRTSPQDAAAFPF